MTNRIRLFFCLVWLALGCLSMGACEGVEFPNPGERRDQVERDEGDEGHEREELEDSESPGPRDRTARGANVRCFSTFDKFKRAMQKQGMGKRGGAYHWHHVVPQHQHNKSTFGEGNLHCTDNLVYLHRDEHTKLSSYYSKGREKLGGKSFREHLKPMGFDEQYAHGLAAMRELEIEVTENPGVPY